MSVAGVHAAAAAAAAVVAAAAASQGGVVDPFAPRAGLEASSRGVASRLMSRHELDGGGLGAANRGVVTPARTLQDHCRPATRPAGFGSFVRTGRVQPPPMSLLPRVPRLAAATTAVTSASSVRRDKRRRVASPALASAG